MSTQASNCKPSAQLNEFVSLSLFGLMQPNRKTVKQTGGRKQTLWVSNETDFSDWLCLIFRQEIVLWWGRAIAANRRSLRKTEGLRQEGRRGKEACGEPSRDVSHPERDMTPCQMNRDRKSWCQETEKRNRFWPCVCSLPFLVLLCVLSEVTPCVCVCARMCLCGDAVWLVLCECVCVR